MELDELKQRWNNTLDKAQVPQAVINESLKQRLNRPLDNLRRRFRNRILLFPLAGVVCLAELYFMKGSRHQATNYLSLWLLVPLCFIMTVYFWVNYRVLVKMQQMDRPVKATLQKQVGLLEKLAWWRLFIFRGLFIIVAIVLEGLFYFSGDKQHLPAWSRHSLSFRVGSYLLFFVVFYFSSKLLIRYQYLQPMTRLKKILQQAEGEENGS